MENTKLTDEERLMKAIEFAIIKHDGQYRKGGLPYATHPLSVSEYVRAAGYGTDYRIAGLFHDLLEDTDATEDEIRSIGGDQVLEAVKLLTKEDGYVMADYIARIKANDMARAVKAADRLHNLRSAFTADEEFRRKYILESLDWYMDFDPRIPVAVKALAESLSKPMAELPLLYESVGSWKIDK
ncbi:MAG: HD domain-containing protein [Bacillota bacterium]|nr:HD domain-containing protein [Bacillota bacterium]